MGAVGAMSKAPPADSKPGVSGESEAIADKYFVCTECLVEGNVQSFVDLFYLTHAVAAVDETDNESANNVTSYETLQFLKSRLTDAEVALCVCALFGSSYRAVLVF